MPCGTGKTMTILSFLVAYRRQCPALVEKIVYCTRTVPEMLKVVEELRDLVSYYQESGINLDLLSVSLSARTNMCINPDVASCSNRLEVDLECRKRTATFARRNAKMSPNRTDLVRCGFFETLQQKTLSDVMPRGIYNLEDLKQFGKEANLCPGLENSMPLIYFI